MPLYAWSSPVGIFLLLTLLSLSAGSSGNIARVEADGVLQERIGLASYYGAAFQGRETASGEPFDKEEMVAAHPWYPLGTIARVTNLENGRSVKVRIIDRGPTAPNQREGVIIDLSKGAARRLGFVMDGRTRVKLEVLEWGKD